MFYLLARIACALLGHQPTQLHGRTWCARCLDHQPTPPRRYPRRTG